MKKIWLLSLIFSLIWITGCPFTGSTVKAKESPAHSESDSGDTEEELLLPTDTPRDKAAEKRLYRKLVRKFHPDLGVTAVEIAY